MEKININIYEYKEDILFIDDENTLVAWYCGSIHDITLATMRDIQDILGVEADKITFTYNRTVPIDYTSKTPTKTYLVDYYTLDGCAPQATIKADSVPHAVGIALNKSIADGIEIVGFHSITVTEIQVEDSLLKLIEFYESIYELNSVVIIDNNTFAVNGTEHSIIYNSADELREAIAEDIKQAITHDMINWGDILK